jgi:hypothetical protein
MDIQTLQKFLNLFELSSAPPENILPWKNIFVFYKVGGAGSLLNSVLIGAGSDTYKGLKTDAYPICEHGSAHGIKTPILDNLVQSKNYNLPVFFNREYTVSEFLDIVSNIKEFRALKKIGDSYLVNRVPYSTELDIVFEQYYPNLTGYDKFVGIQIETAEDNIQRINQMIKKVTNDLRKRSMYKQVVVGDKLMTPDDTDPLVFYAYRQLVKDYRITLKNVNLFPYSKIHNKQDFFNYCNTITDMDYDKFSRIYDIWEDAQDDTLWDQVKYAIDLAEKYNYVMPEIYK